MSPYNHSISPDIIGICRYPLATALAARWSGIYALIDRRIGRMGSLFVMAGYPTRGSRQLI